MTTSQTQIADKLTQQFTAYDTFNELLNAKGGFYPSLPFYLQKTQRRRREMLRLVDLYNEAQKERGDERRAFTGTTEISKTTANAIIQRVLQQEKDGWYTNMRVSDWVYYLTNDKGLTEGEHFSIENRGNLQFVAFTYRGAASRAIYCF